MFYFIRLLYSCDFLLQPLSNAERKKRYIEKLKETGKFDEFKKKNADYVKKKRERIQVGLTSLPKYVREKTKRLNREYNRKKTAEYRQRKKESKGFLVDTTNHLPLVNRKAQSDKMQPEDGSFKTPSALQKAATKIKRSLPSTLPKKKQALTKVLKTFKPEDIQDMFTETKTKPKVTKGVKQFDIDKVRAFYERDDISRMSPNVKDCRKFADPATGVKEYRQLRFLMYKLAVVYSMFEKYVKNGKIFLK